MIRRRVVFPAPLGPRMRQIDPSPRAELVSVNEARSVYRFRKDEITAARLIEDISHTAPIKEVGLEEAKIDDIIRTVYRQGIAADQRGGAASF